MCEGQRVCPVFKGLLHREAGSASLGVPAFELAQITARDILKDFEPIFDGGGLSVVAFEIKIERLFISSIPDKPFKHTDDFGAFVINLSLIHI